MKVKLQPPSGTELSPFSPIQPTAAITQVMLLANPMKVSVRESMKPTWDHRKYPVRLCQEVLA